MRNLTNCAALFPNTHTEKELFYLIIYFVYCLGRNVQPFFSCAGMWMCSLLSSQQYFITKFVYIINSTEKYASKLSWWQISKQSSWDNSHVKFFTSADFQRSSISLSSVLWYQNPDDRNVAGLWNVSWFDNFMQLSA